jgi:hypothetical protein
MSKTKTLREMMDLVNESMTYGGAKQIEFLNRVEQDLPSWMSDEIHNIMSREVHDLDAVKDYLTTQYKEYSNSFDNRELARSIMSLLNRLD